MLSTTTATIPSTTQWKPRFFSIWSGQALSLVGSSLTQFVLVWWITQETGSANALAIAGVAAMLPSALFSPLGGAIADRLSRRMVMIVADAITAGCMAILVFLFSTNLIQLWHIYSMLFIRAIMQSFQQPAMGASTANLVPEDWLNRVAGMNQTLQGVMTIAAAPLGALAMAILPTQGALMIDIDVVTAVLGIVPLLFFQIPQPLRSQGSNSPLSILHDIREGAVYIYHKRGLFALYIITGLVVLTLMPTFSLTPLLVKHHFNSGVNEVALMEGISGIGIILGGILIGFWKFPFRRVVVIMLSFTVSCGTVALTALAPGNMLWLAIFWWFLSGFTFSTGHAPMMALLQTIIPNELQGRILSLLTMVFGFAGPIGLLVAGPIGEAYGVRVVFIAGGILSALVCIVSLVIKPLWNIEKSAEQLQPPPSP